MGALKRSARARMLAPTISLSQRVNRLTLKAALLYTWMIGHADDQGRLCGDAEYVKAAVVPLRTDIAIEEVDDALGSMYENGLIELYEDDKGRAVIQMCDWWEYQSLRDPQPSRYPPPDGWTDLVSQVKRDNTTGRFQ